MTNPSKSKLNAKDVVYDLLTHYPKMRDDDRRLIVNVWAKDMQQMGLDPNKFKEFFDLFKGDKLTHYDSITRCRRKLQEKHKELRGEKYQERQQEEEVWKDEIRKA